MAGRVVDAKGRPVAGARLWLDQIPIEPGRDEVGPTWYSVEVLTDEEGRFGIYGPQGGVFDRLMWIAPPAGSGLSVEEVSIGPVNRSDMVITLRSVPTTKVSCTFRFVDPNSQVVDRQRLARYELTTAEPGRLLPRTLRYAQFKDGLELLAGTIVSGWLVASRAVLHSVPVRVPESGPAELVIRFDTVRVYAGRVYYADTGQPAAGLYVLANHRLASKEAADFTDQDWQLIREQATAEGQGALEVLSASRDRVGLTDRQGRFQIKLVGTGGNLSRFKAIKAGFRSRSRYPDPPPQVGPGDGPQRLIHIDLELVPDRPTPQFVFYDESGPITDPNMLAKVSIHIVRPEGRRTTLSFNGLSPEVIEAGTYTATAIWDGKVYEFGPVEIGEDLPQLVEFRPARIKDQFTITRCIGQVVHGISGRPISDVIVFSTDPKIPTLGLPILDPQQWQAIHRENLLDPNGSALAPFKSACHLSRVTRTDANGMFEIRLAPFEIGEFTQIWAVEQDHLPVRIDLRYPVLPEGPTRTGPSWESFEPDLSGVVRLPPILLFPAATVRVHLLLSEYDVFDRRVRVYAHWQAAAHEKAPCLAYIYGGAPITKGPIISTQSRLQANQDQVFQVLAGFDIEISMVPRQYSQYIPVKVGPVRLEQGEVLDLGRLEFRKGIPVTVKVVDLEGRPVAGVRVSYSLTDNLVGAMALTDADGVAVLHLPPNSSGSITAMYDLGKSAPPQRQSIPFTLGSQQDKTREFTIYLPISLDSLV